MAIQFPIPQGLNENWQGAQDWLTGLLGNIFDPNKQTQPPALPGMQTQPQSLPELMAQGLMAGQGTPKEAYESGIMGMGPMPLGVPNYKNPLKSIWNDEALKVFGKTYDPKEAGYLLRKGQLVDFSGRNKGAGESARGQRYLDHRDIWQIGENLGEPVDMVSFMDNANAIRMSYMGDDLMLDLVQPPANPQLNKLSEFISDYRPENIYLDITSPEGRTLKSVEINKPTYGKLKKALIEHFGK